MHNNADLKEQTDNINTNYEIYTFFISTNVNKPHPHRISKLENADIVNHKSFNLLFV